MAARAIPGCNGTGHVGVHPAHTHGDRRKSHPGSMAGITGSRGGNVGSRLAGGAGAVMAGGAGAWRDQGVGISGGQPGRTFMARIARGVRRQMLGRLACGSTAVMTAIACPLNHSLGYPVLETAGCPADFIVAGVAGRCGGNMRRRLPWRPTAGTVAGRAIAGSSPEQALGVAGFAAFPGVGTIQKKARGVVVKRQAHGSHSLGWRQTGNNHGQHKKDRCGQLSYQTINDYFLISHRASHGVRLNRQGMTSELRLQILSDSMTNIRKVSLPLCNLCGNARIGHAELGGTLSGFNVS